MASEGFEPPKAVPADLQSDPFGRLGNSPKALPTGVFTNRVRAIKDSGCLAPGVTRVHPKDAHTREADTAETNTQETGPCGLALGGWQWEADTASAGIGHDDCR